MKYAVSLALIAFVLATPLKAQEIDRLAPMLQSVIDLPEMEQVYGDLGIVNKLCLAQTPVLPPGIRLTKFGHELEILDEESAFFRCGAYVKFVTLSVSESSSIAVKALVVGPEVRTANDGIEVSIMLKEQPDGWKLESFRRAE